MRRADAGRPEVLAIGLLCLVLITACTPPPAGYAVVGSWTLSGQGRTRTLVFSREHVWRADTVDAQGKSTFTAEGRWSFEPRTGLYAISSADFSGSHRLEVVGDDLRSAEGSQSLGHRVR
jgi:hypothetical protein